MTGLCTGERQHIKGLHHSKRLSHKWKWSHTLWATIVMRHWSFSCHTSNFLFGICVSWLMEVISRLFTWAVTVKMWSLWASENSNVRTSWSTLTNTSNWVKGGFCSSLNKSVSWPIDFFYKFKVNKVNFLSLQGWICFVLQILNLNKRIYR